MKKIIFSTSLLKALLVTIFYLDCMQLIGQSYSPCFYKTSFISTGLNNYDLKKADFNNDGKDDIAISGYNWLTNSGNMQVYLNNGVVSISPYPSYTFNSTSGIDFCTSDFDSDGNQDIAIPNNSNSVRILSGNGNGTFNFGGSFLAPLISVMCASDFNNDSKPDLAVACGNGSLSVLSNAGAGSFVTTSVKISTVTLPSPGVEFYNIIADDFNNDGNKDLIVVTNYNAILILLGNGNGTFSNPVTFTISSPGQVVSSDINNDGNKDLVLSLPSSIGVYLGNGNGSFSAVNPISTPQIYSNFLVSDVNNDNKLDICYSDYFSMAFFLGTGLGTFNTNPSYYNTGDAYTRIINGNFDFGNELDFVAMKNSNFTSLLNKKPTITGSSTVCAGQSVTLIANNSTSNCYWPVDNVFSNVLVVSPTVNTTYTAASSSANCPFGSSYSTTITLTVIPPPVISVTAPSSTVCAGNSLILTASGVVSYTWGQGINTSSISVSPNVNTVYTVLGTGSNNCSNSASITVNVEACVGLPDRGNRLLQSIHLYPNPTNNTLFFSLKDMPVSVNNLIEIEVINSIGKSQFKTSSFNADTFIDVSNLASGVYFLKVSLEKNEQAYIKFSKL